MEYGLDALISTLFRTEVLIVLPHHCLSPCTSAARMILAARTSEGIYNTERDHLFSLSESESVYFAHCSQRGPFST